MVKVAVKVAVKSAVKSAGDGLRVTDCGWGPGGRVVSALRGPVGSDLGRFSMAWAIAHFVAHGYGTDRSNLGAAGAASRFWGGGARGRRAKIP
jgi:hypothetical protein